MLNHHTSLRCSRRTATMIILATIFLLAILGCQSLFRSAGLSDEQAATQTAELKRALEGAATAAIADIQTGLAEGHDLKTIAVKTGSAFLWKIIAAAGASVGVVLNGLLAKWLNTEKKITRAVITGVEKSNDPTAKQAIHYAATIAGIEPQLNARVKALT